MPSLILPLLVLAVIAVLGIAARPWLAHRETRDKAVTLCLCGGLLSLALYFHLGEPFMTEDISLSRRQHAELRERIHELEGMRDKGGMELPEWVALGTAYMATEQYSAAEDALRHAVLASEGEPNLILAYGKAQMLAADGTVTEGAEEAFTLAARLLPDNPEPVFLLALGRMQAGDTEGARAQFRELLPKLPPQAPLRRVIESRLQDMGE